MASALSTLQPVDDYPQHSLLPTDRRHLEPSGVPPSEMVIPIPAGWTENMVAGRFNRDDERIAKNLGVAIGEALDAESMV